MRSWVNDERFVVDPIVVDLCEEVLKPDPVSLQDFFDGREHVG